jgi:hypothetical protein
MLNVHNKGVFKYHLARALEGSEMREDHRATFMANVLSKASQMSTVEAKKYIDSVVEQGHLDEETADKAFRLLDRYTTHR